MPFVIQGGRSKSSVTPAQLMDGLEGVLQSIRQDTIDALRDSLKDVNRIASGVLAQSIDIRFKHGESFLSFTLYADEYWKFVDKGVDGTKIKYGSPFKFKKKNIKQQAALDFIASRGISQWKDQSGKVLFDVKKKPPISKTKGLDKDGKKSFNKARKTDRYKTLAFLVGRRIAQKGIKPTHFVGNVINDEWKNEFRMRITKYFGDNLDDLIFG